MFEGQVVMHRYGEFKFGTITEIVDGRLTVQFLRDGVMRTRSLLPTSVIAM